MPTTKKMQKCTRSLKKNKADEDSSLGWPWDLKEGKRCVRKKGRCSNKWLFYHRAKGNKRKTSIKAKIMVTF